MSDKLIFENLWMRDPVAGAKAVFVTRNEEGAVIAQSTAEKIFLRQLRNHMYNIRVTPQIAPMQFTDVIAATLDFLESVYREEAGEKCIGIVTEIEDEEMKKAFAEAMLPCGLVYIGNTSTGGQLRVAYFKGTTLAS